MLPARKINLNEERRAISGVLYYSFGKEGRNSSLRIPDRCIRVRDVGRVKRKRKGELGFGSNMIRFEDLQG